MLMVLWSLGAFAVYFIYTKLFKKRANASEMPLHVPDWQQNKVYLMQFPVSPLARSISPFALKLETWLRMTKIPYEARYTLRSSEKGQIPFIEYNGRHYPDSNLIIEFLKNEFKVDPEEKLDDVSCGVAHSVRVMLENHTAFIGFYWRYGFHFEEFKRMFVNIPMPPWRMRLFSLVFPSWIRFRFYLQGIGRHSLADIERFSFTDLKSISQIMGTRKFLLGEEPTTVDCALFGHLVQFLYIPLDFPQKKFMETHCPNLVEFVDRMREEFWPDWEAMCDAASMEGKKSRFFE